MRKIIRLAISIICCILLNVNFSYAQDKQNDSILNEALFCKVWGFLKYYHPNVANGKFDWDEQFLTQLPLIQNAKNKQEINSIYNKWIEGLGKVAVCKSCNDDIINSKYFTRNLDLSWLESEHYFSTAVIEKLQFIKNNRYQGKPFYVGKMATGNIEILNESPPKNESFPDTNTRLLSLSKFWNTVDYFFPYKYLTDKKWDDVLVEMIEKFDACKNEVAYEMAMLETVAKTDDSHGLFKTMNTVDYFGTSFFPAKIKLIEGKAIITSIPNDSLGKVNGLRVGDIILQFDEKNIQSIIKDKSKYLSGSNINSKLRGTHMFLSNGSEKTVKVLLVRDHQRIEKTVSRYPYDAIYDTEVTPEKYRIIDKSIGYVDMAQLEMKDVDKMMEHFKDTKGMIIDLRNYPRFIPYVLAGRFITEKKDFVSIAEPDLSYPGRFKFAKNQTITPLKKYHPGKIVLLVDENTQSRAEYSAMLLQAGDNVITLGSQTAGADGNVSLINFSSKYKSYLSGTGIYYPDGTDTQRKGIKIDIEVRSTIIGIQSGKDEVLDKALEHFK